jgi:transcriptional antiterminator NusG
MPEAAEAPEEGAEAPAEKEWYILKVQVNREDSIRAALLRRIKIEGLEEFFDEIVVPTEEVAEFNKSGKRKVVRRKLYPGYILVHMVVNDDTWFVVRETPGVGDFTGSSGKPTPMNARDVERILRLGVAQEDRGGQIKTAIPFKVGDRVRVKDGHFQNFEGEVDSIDEANGRITVMINIFNRSTPVELEHWQVESV